MQCSVVAVLELSEAADLGWFFLVADFDCQVEAGPCL